MTEPKATVPYEQAAVGITELDKVKALSPASQLQRAQVYALLAVAEAVRELAPTTDTSPPPPGPEPSPELLALVLGLADGRSVGEIVNTLGYDSIPLADVAAALAKLAADGKVRTEAQRVWRT